MQDQTEVIDVNRSQQSKAVNYFNSCVPQFPEEIFYHFLKFLGLNDLLNCRYVHSNWNQIVCTRLRLQEQVSLTFENEKSLFRFLATMFNRIQPLPFGTFKFEGHHPSDLFLHSIGTNILNCVFDFQQVPPLSLPSLLKVMPNLGKLHIFGPYLKLDWVAFDFPKLPRLRSLLLHRARDQENRDDVPLDIVKHWIGQMPKLIEFETGFTILIESAPTFLQFLNSVTQLTVKLKVKFLEVPIELEDGISKMDLKLFVANDGVSPTENANASTWINIFAPCLEKLYLNICGNGTEISRVLINLDTLSLHYTHSVNERFKPEYFPCLSKIIIKISGGNRNGTHFWGTVFPTVKSLYICGGFHEDGGPLEPWDKIFPNIKNFRVQGNVQQRHFDRLMLLYKDLHQLNITSSLGLDYAYTNFSQTAIWNSALSNPELEASQRLENATHMPKLRILEIVGYDKKILMSLLMLTQLRVMPPLDFLGFYRNDCTEQNLESVGKALLGNTNWHKEIKFGSTYGGGIWEK